MLELTDPRALRRICDDVRRDGRRVGLVPTMGYLHAGHLSLVRRARELADYVVVSIFVNPTQFGPTEDLARYPRDLAADRARCLAAGVDCLFAPDSDAVYPPGYQTYVAVEQVSQGLCGDRRPGHFRGVATVVAKLFNIVGPGVAVFGEKDFQQLLVIRRMTADLDLPVEIVGAPIVREPDGLAMSSRNAYLDPDQRRQATCLHRALEAVRARSLSTGTPLPVAEAVGIAAAIIEAQPAARVDYVELRDAETLEPLGQLRPGRSLLALAVFVGQTRLIDNTVL